VGERKRERAKQEEKRATIAAMRERENEMRKVYRNNGRTIGEKEKRECAIFRSPGPRFLLSSAINSPC
jgi:hypothetical protein